MIRSTCLIVLITCLSLGSMIAGADPAKPVAPTTQPAGVENQRDKLIDKLIADLADPSFNVRDKACQELAALGDSAMPALKQALQSEDPSIRSYAEHLVKRQERRNTPVPETRGFGQGNVRIRNGRINAGRLVLGDALHRAVRVEIRNGVKATSVTEDGRTINIREGPEGVAVEVISQVNGKQEKATYAAKNAQELKEKHPEGFKLYEQHGLHNGIQRIRINDGAVQLEGVLRLDALDAIKLLDHRRALIDEINLEGVLEIQRNLNDLRLNRQQIHQQLRDIQAEHEALVDEMRLRRRGDVVPRDQQ